MNITMHGVGHVSICDVFCGKIWSLDLDLDKYVAKSSMNIIRERIPFYLIVNADRLVLLLQDIQVNY